MNDLKWLSRPFAMEQKAMKALADVAKKRLMEGSEVEAAKKHDNMKRYQFEPEDLMDVEGGVATIRVYGTILRGAPFWMNATDPDIVGQALQLALEDRSVRGIHLDVDSPGGVVDGCLCLADAVREANEQKPVIATADSLMASAAYEIASGSGKILVTRDAAIGSIGVYSVIDDFSAFFRTAGVETNVVKAGSNKAIGVLGAVVSDADLDVVKEEIDEYYRLFVEVVAKGRGMSVEEVLPAADGRVYLGERAVSLGLADEVLTGKQIMDRAAQLGKAARKGVKGGAVTLENTKPEANAGEEGGAPEATSQPPASPPSAPVADASAVEAERKRVGFIMDKAQPHQQSLMADLVKSGASELEALEKLHADLVENPPEAATVEETTPSGDADPKPAANQEALQQVKDASSKPVGQEPETIIEDGARASQDADGVDEANLRKKWDAMSSEEKLGYGDFKCFKFTAEEEYKETAV